MEMKKQMRFVRNHNITPSTSGTLKELKEAIAAIDFPEDWKYDIECGEDYFEIELHEQREETDDELARRAQQQNEWIAQQEEREKKEFERLKQKFENGSPKFS